MEPLKNDPMASEKMLVAMTAKASKMEAQVASLDLVLICAQDIVNAWPQTTIRTLGEMTKRMDTLRQALEAAQK